MGKYFLSLLIFIVIFLPQKLNASDCICTSSNPKTLQTIYKDNNESDCQGQEESLNMPLINCTWEASTNVCTCEGIVGGEKVKSAKETSPQRECDDEQEFYDSKQEVWECTYVGEEQEKPTEIKPVKLPNPLGAGRDNIRIVAGGIGKAMIGVLGSIAFLIFVITGVRMIISQGNAEQLKVVKDAFFWASIGVVVALGSYWALAKIIGFLTGF